MFTRARRFVDNFFKKSRSINKKPLNPLSLIVIIIVDLFILFNVFAGLDQISRWQLSPTQAYPCISDWENYRDSKQKKDSARRTLRERDYRIISSALDRESRQPSIDNQQDRLGNVSPSCLNYAQLKDQVNIPANQTIQQSITQKQTKISSLEQANSSIRSQYDSTLIEKIAGQNSSQSINTVSAAKAKQTLAQNKISITNFTTEISALKQSLTNKPESINLINSIKDDSKYQLLTQEYEHASFWYPSIQLAFQALFLLPLLAIALLVHRVASSKGAGLIALISWHILIISFIPLLLKIFEFLQVGVLFQLLLYIITPLFGSLVFLVSYLYIFLIPLVGFTIIKISQRFASSNKSQDTISMRFQNQACLNCAKRIRPQDAYCPHCGYDQYVECQACHELTYKHLAHCKHCGALQDPISLSANLPTGNHS
jgi:ABC-type multidrug transport system fused ATPase/permease subunit